MLTVDDVTFAYPDREPALEDVSLAVDRGEAVRLAGDSGAGKSTLVRLATGSIPRVHGGRIGGHVLLDGDPVERIPAERLPARVGHVPQDPETAFVARTVRRELVNLLANAGVPDVEPRADQALSCFDAQHLAGREVATLSGGETARVALACAVAAEPDLLVLDEPHAQLDPEGRRQLADTLRGLVAGGRGLLLAAHDPHPFEDVVDRVHRVSDPPTDEAPPELPAPPTGDPVLELDGAVHAYEDGPRVGPLDLTVREGEVVALAGANGSGKTTALHLAAGLHEPEAGRVRLLGEDPRDLEATERARRLGVAFQHPAWHITQDTLAEEVALTGDRLDRPVDVDAWLERLGLDGHGEAHPWDLSGGERQRMAVGTALAHEPPVAMLDEPTRGLDRANRDRLARILAERTREGKATVLASHHAWMHELAHRTVELDATDDAEPAERPPGSEVLYA
jgi:energy-coupling factor transport system ATP-binding protein